MAQSKKADFSHQGLPLRDWSDPNDLLRHMQCRSCKLGRCPKLDLTDEEQSAVAVAVRKRIDPLSERLRLVRACAINRREIMSAAAILIVVWLGLGGGATYQVPFTAIPLCEAARKEVLDDADRVRANMTSDSPVVVSAVCLTVSGVTK